MNVRQVPILVNTERDRLISILASRGIRDRRVLEAMGRVPRENFVSEALRPSAYEDHALPIDAGQTISQPYMVALMTQELSLTGDERVLEIGTGSGYQAAVLSQLARKVVSIERIEELSRQAAERLTAVDCENVELHVGDGSLGWPAGAPYDRIIVTAGAPRVPEELYRQLAEEGRLVIPIGSRYPQILKTVDKTPDGPLITDICECSFVPLIGASAWPGEDREDVEP